MNLLQLWSALNPLGLTLARLLVTILWQSALLLGAMGMLTWSLRKRAASLRHALWVGAILLVPLLPVLGQVFTHAGVPQLPVRVEALALPPVTESTVATAGETALIGVTPTELSREPVILQLYARPWTVVVLLYAYGLIRMLGWLGIGLFRLKQWIRRATPAGQARVLAAFELARNRLRLSRPVTVVESVDTPTPLTVGILKPVVLLPESGAQHLAESDIQKIALHECAHIRRHDTLWLRLMLLVRTLFFFQPLLWWACRQATLLAEESCDDAVLASTGEALPYANLLTRLAERTALPSTSKRMATGLLFSRSAFVRRMEAIIDESRSRFRRPSRHIIGTALLAAFICVTLAVAVPLNGKERSGRPGTIFAEGKVVDEQGSPLAQASVYACASNDQGFKLTAETRSDKDGRFRFDDLPSPENGEWNYMIYAHKQGYAWASCHRNHGHGNNVPDPAGISDATLTLLPPADFTGRVLNRQGQPIAGARVSAMFCCESENGNTVYYWVWTGGTSFGTVVSDQEGRFRFESVPAESEVRLQVTADGYAMIGINSYSWEDGDLRRLPFHVNGKEAEIRLGPESRILGSVVDAESGKPLADIPLSAYEKDRLAHSFTRTDGAGRFAIKGIPAGAYHIKATLPPENSYRVRIVTVQVSEGEVREGVKLRAEEGVRVLGRVLDKTTGKAIERARLTCVLREERALVARTLTDARGEFRFVLLPGTYGVGAGRPSYDSGGHTAAVVADGQERVRLADILLGTEPKAIVNVSVVDAQGRPAPGVKVYQYRQGASKVTGADGRVEIDLAPFASLPMVTFKFMSSDGSQKAVWVISADELAKPPARKQIALRTVGSIQGIVRAPDGKPIQNAEITLWMHVPLPSGPLFSQDLQTITGPDGRYEIRGLVPGRMYNISAAGSAGSGTGKTHYDNFSAKHGETLTLPEVTLPRAERSVSGRFLDEDGNPVSLLRFNVEGPQTRRQELRADENGEFEIQDVATEDLRLYVYPPRLRRFSDMEFKINKASLRQDVTDLVLTVKRK